MVSEKDVSEALEQVVDPELGFNVVELGFIYRIRVKGSSVKITMTLTSPACPMLSRLVSDVEDKVRELEGVKAVEVELAFNPPWTPERASKRVRKALGL